MWNYEKRLQYPVKISQPNAKAAQIIISQFGGPNPGKLEYLLDGKERLSPLWKGRSLFLNSEQFSPHFPAFGNLTVRFSVAQTNSLISVYCSCEFSAGNLIQYSSIFTL